MHNNAHTMPDDRNNNNKARSEAALVPKSSSPDAEL
jgi:hypothetical protein